MRPVSLVHIVGGKVDEQRLSLVPHLVQLQTVQQPVRHINRPAGDIACHKSRRLPIFGSCGQRQCFAMRVVCIICVHMGPQCCHGVLAKLPSGVRNPPWGTGRENWGGGGVPCMYIVDLVC